MKFPKSAEFLVDFRLTHKDGLTQRDIGQACEVSAQYVSNAERGLCTLPISRLKKLNKKYPEFSVSKYVKCIEEDKASQLALKIKKML